MLVIKVSFNGIKPVRALKPVFFTFLLILACGPCYAQNYTCVQATAKHYFINGSGYLRGIRIDSTKMVNGDSVLFPFRTARGPVPNALPPPLDSNGGSWLGKTITI